MSKMDSLFVFCKSASLLRHQSPGCRKVNLIISWGFPFPLRLGGKAESSVEHPQAGKAIRRQVHLVCGQQLSKLTPKNPLQNPLPFSGGRG